MSWQTSSGVLALRNLGRALGINKIIGSRMRGEAYEEQYDNAFSSALRADDCVWDVGANVGHYTKLFSEVVGLNGRVVAFEPSLDNFERLVNECTEIGNVSLLNIGLGSRNGTVQFLQGKDDLGATSRVVSSSPDSVDVELRTGESLIRQGEVPPPNALKIDVEGFEKEVLEGLGATLDRAELHLIGIEVHFGLLKERGLTKAPRDIEVMLKQRGFSLRWTDSSHLLAQRRNTSV